MKKVTKFDIAEYLDNDEMIKEYLNTVLEEGDSKDIITALGYIAKALGMSKIAEETGLSRPSLYKALSEGAKPQFETILKVLRAIGGNLNLKTAKLLKEINSRTHQISTFPEIGKSVDFKNTRAVSLGHFSILYQHIENSIIITAFWDNRDDPSKLLSILKE